jgi:hypothetical protein
MSNGKKTRIVYRSAITGRFVTKAYAQRNPKTTVGETIQVGRRKKK